jgi:hypothetical protein
MEVHHHAHTSRKKWTHYFWEFIMLFLAVFCGFLAEYQLEHKIEKDREKIYIRSFYEDLGSDVMELERLQGVLSRQLLSADSVSYLMKQVKEKTPANMIYVYLRRLGRSSTVNFYANDRTIVQLRNSGGMRLIHNKGVSDSMVSYYREVEWIRFLNDESLNFKRTLRDIYPDILYSTSYAKTIDSGNQVINPVDTLYLRSLDPDRFNTCLYYVYEIKGLTMGLKRRISELAEKATLIRKYLTDQYHL